MARTEFRQNEHDGLEYDKDPIQNGPKSATRLVRNGAVSTRASSEIQHPPSFGNKNRVRDIVRVPRVERRLIEIAVRERVDGLDVVDQYENARCEDEQEGDDA